MVALNTLTEFGAFALLRFRTITTEIYAVYRTSFAGNDAAIRATAFRNSSLQGAYLLLAARALGFDCGPMSGFDAAAVNAAFFAGTTVETNFICSIGRGTSEGLFPRLPRLAFDEAARLA